MKNTSLITLFLLISASVSLQAQKTILTVQIEALKSDKGKLFAALYENEDTWLKKEFMGEISEIQNGKATVVFRDIPQGKYAISTFHDENDNGKLDTGWFGIPKEPYASSRGAVGRFGPPKWEDAVMELNQNEMSTTIKY